MNCSEITRMGIFDVHVKSTEESLSQSLISWLTSSRFSTEAEATSAAASLGIKLPDIPIPMNADGTYANSHSKTWSEAVTKYLETHTDARSRVYEETRTANPSIIAAWKECQGRSGMRCWATQTQAEDNIVLNIEIRPLFAPFDAVPLLRIDHSDNVQPVNPSGTKVKVGIQPVQILFRRVGPMRGGAVSFSVVTKDANYPSASCDLIGLEKVITITQNELDGRITGYVQKNPSDNLINNVPGSGGEGPGTAGFSFEVEEPGKYVLFVRYAAQVSRPCDIFVNLYNESMVSTVTDYLDFLRRFAGLPVIPDRLAETTGGWDPAHVKDFEEAIVDLRKGLNNIIIRRREPQLPGAHAGGGGTPNLIPSIQGITLVKRIPPQSLPELTASTDFY